jgi:DNA processing protein
VELLRRTGSPRAALNASGKPRPTSREVSAALVALRRVCARALPFGSPAFPPRLAALGDPPPLLLVRGDVEALAAHCVAIVGSRAATVYGRRVARDLAGALARAGVVVVSGLARGVDGEAHAGALAAGGRTVAVLASGPDVVYPPEHARLAGSIAEQGALVTEMPPGTRPLRQFFPMRNRLISGLCVGVVVVEARERSGSLITAAHAADQGIDVFAVPGPIGAPTSTGPNRLIRDGAIPVTEASDIIAALGLRASPPAADPGGDRATPEARAILAALMDAPATRDALCRRLHRSPADLALALLELELEGRVAEDRDGLLRCVGGV